MRKRWKWVGLSVLAFVLVIAYAIAFLIDEPLRRTTESQMNARLKGYTARIGKLDFHPIGFSVDFYDVVMVQDAHPDPPVMHIKRLSASVQWSAIIRGRIVADFELIEPNIYVDRTHFVRELEDPTPVKDRGWQEALQAMYPAKINEFVVKRGALTYVDSGQERPLTLKDLEVVVQDVRNVRSDPDVYPSPIEIKATVFDEGRLAIQGKADFLRVPHLGVKGHIDLEKVALDYLKPIVARYGFTLAAGTFGGRGNVEYSPEVAILDLDEVRVDGLRGDYAYKKRTAQPVKEAAAKTADAAAEVANKPDVLLKAKRISASGATVGFVNQEATPHYRVFLADTNLVIENFTNQRTEGTATARLDGRFMGSGVTTVRATFRPETNGPDFDLERADREHRPQGAERPAAGAREGRRGVRGVLGLLRGEREGRGASRATSSRSSATSTSTTPSQDRDKSFGRKLKEKAAEVVGKVLKNRPRDEVVDPPPDAQVELARGEQHGGGRQILVEVLAEPGRHDRVRDVRDDLPVHLARHPAHGVRGAALGAAEGEDLAQGLLGLHGVRPAEGTGVRAGAVADPADEELVLVGGIADVEAGLLVGVGGGLVLPAVASRC